MSAAPPAQFLILLRPLGAVLGAALLTVGHALRVEHAADDVIAHAGKVLDAAAADHDHRVLLQIVAFTGDVADDLEAVRQAHLGDLAKCRVRLLRGRGVDAGAHAALLRACLHVARLLAIALRFPRVADQLLYRRHAPHHLLRPRPAPVEAYRRVAFAGAEASPMRQNRAPRRQGWRSGSKTRGSTLPAWRELAGSWARSCPLLGNGSV